MVRHGSPGVRRAPRIASIPSDPGPEHLFATLGLRIRDGQAVRPISMRAALGARRGTPVRWLLEQAQMTQRSARVCIGDRAVLVSANAV